MLAVIQSQRDVWTAIDEYSRCMRIFMTHEIFTKDQKTEAFHAGLSFVPAKMSLDFLQPLRVGVLTAYRKKSSTQTDTDSLN